MLSFANSLVAHAARLIQAVQEESTLWSVCVHGRVVGSLMCEAGVWRLSWFKDADPRLTSFAGTLDGDVEVLASSLGARIGAPVRLELLSV